jgi:Icc-related predicted phosphoesterase
MSTHVTRILCAADPAGSEESVARLAEAAAEHDAQLILIAGDLVATGDGDGRASYGALFRRIGRQRIPSYWVPGAKDAPIGAFLREAASAETAFALLRAVHGTAALTPDGHIAIAGMGGEIDDDPDSDRDEERRLRYPRWEAEYRLKILGELGELERILLFSTPPAHKGLGTPGSETVSELIATYRARLAIVGGPPTSETIGRTLVVAPGALSDGHYATVDLATRDVELRDLVMA